MNEIKSKKASEYIHEYIPWAYMTLAIKTIQIAEQEAEERHAKEMKELGDRAIDAFLAQCPRDECTKYGVKVGTSYFSCRHGKCKRYIEFAQKLTEKQ